MGSKKYNSRISPIIWSIAWLIIIGVFYLTIKPMFENPNFSYLGILTLIWIPILTLMLIIMLGIRYHLNSNELIIKIGPIVERRIAIDKIWSLERSYNPISSPANSLKRLKVKYRNGEVLISPSNEKDFIEQLKSKNPRVRIFNLKKDI